MRSIAGAEALACARLGTFSQTAPAAAPAREDLRNCLRRRVIGAPPLAAIARRRPADQARPGQKQTAKARRREGLRAQQGRRSVPTPKNFAPSRLRGGSS